MAVAVLARVKLKGFLYNSKTQFATICTNSVSKRIATGGKPNGCFCRLTYCIVAIKKIGDSSATDIFGVRDIRIDLSSTFIFYGLKVRDVFSSLLLLLFPPHPVKNGKGERRARANRVA